MQPRAGTPGRNRTFVAYASSLVPTETSPRRELVPPRGDSPLCSATAPEHSTPSGRSWPRWRCWCHSRCGHSWGPRTDTPDGGAGVRQRRPASVAGGRVVGTQGGVSGRVGGRTRRGCGRPRPTDGVIRRPRPAGADGPLSGRCSSATVSAPGRPHTPSGPERPARTALHRVFMRGW
jgi:hypothetical protein